MPSPERVADFIAHVKADRFVAAIERFYTEDATMQENAAPPRGGRDALVAHERQVLAAVKSIHAKKADWLLIDGDRVVINWVFEITGPDGKTRVMEEIACQDWRDDRIFRERFFFDPASIVERPGGV
ncbi:nuclear transport factor 2 family protein [Parvibaculum sp.]|uniref:nuclear transport factor 2 family protein n=1 Tax=Parvibaculum sp. TaxID=2024848 RepID=UPI0034A06935